MTALVIPAARSNFRGACVQSHANDRVVSEVTRPSHTVLHALRRDMLCIASAAGGHRPADHAVLVGERRHRRLKLTWLDGLYQGRLLALLDCSVADQMISASLRVFGACDMCRTELRSRRADHSWHREQNAMIFERLMKSRTHELDGGANVAVAGLSRQRRLHELFKAANSLIRCHGT